MSWKNERLKNRLKKIIETVLLLCIIIGVIYFIDQKAHLFSGGENKFGWRYGAKEERKKGKYEWMARELKKDQVLIHGKKAMKKEYSDPTKPAPPGFLEKVKLFIKESFRKTKGFFLRLFGS